MGRPLDGPTLKLIRLALLGAVLVFGVVLAWLTGREGFAANAALAGGLRLAFLLLALAALGALAAVRSAQARAYGELRGQFTLIGWALGESVALFGGVAWLLAGEVLLYVMGVVVLAAAFFLVPVPGDS